MTILSVRAIETKPIIKTLNRTEITITNDKVTKLKHSPFFILNPTSKKDMNFLRDYLLELKNSEKSLLTLGGICFRAFEYDSIFEDVKDNNQLDLNFKRLNETYKHIENSIFKFIEPSTNLYRDRFSSSIKKYCKLEKIPFYLLEHLKYIIDKKNKDENLDEMHLRFWKSLFLIDKKKGRKKSLHFIKWHESIQKNRGADIFIPPTPYIKEIGGDFLVEKAIEINSDANDIIDGDVATYFEFDIEIFRNMNLINRILNYISENPNKCKFTMFKIHNIDKILSKGYGLSTLEHFELFLRTLKSIKENKKSVFGVINGDMVFDSGSRIKHGCYRNDSSNLVIWLLLLNSFILILILWGKQLNKSSLQNKPK
ncbi:MAG: hypothetical protein AABY22_16630 [Nanoarchaeota archaeon]